MWTLKEDIGWGYCATYPGDLSWLENHYSDYEKTREEYEADRDRHNGGLNYLFYDGHVEWLRPEFVLEHQTELLDYTVVGP